MTNTLTPRRRSFLDTLAENNVFYLLSAACMLAGCLLVANTTTWSPISLGRLIPLIITLNVYELIVVALALFLIVRKKLLHDGVMLLVLEALFLVDIGFLPPQPSPSSPSTQICGSRSCASPRHSSPFRPPISCWSTSSPCATWFS